jgi:hypothetical protein
LAAPLRRCTLLGPVSLLFVSHTLLLAAGCATGLCRGHYRRRRPGRLAPKRGREGLCTEESGRAPADRCAAGVPAEEAPSATVQAHGAFRGELHERRARAAPAGAFYRAARQKNVSVKVWLPSMMMSFKGCTHGAERGPRHPALHSSRDQPPFLHKTTSLVATALAVPSTGINFDTVSSPSFTNTTRRYS